jgi:hypothetical protein
MQNALLRKFRRDGVSKLTHSAGSAQVFPGLTVEVFEDLLACKVEENTEV